MKYQVVILAGGESSRFFPFNGLHKSFFKIAGKTILERTVESVKKLDPSEILLVLGSKNFDKEKKACEDKAVFKGVKYVCEENPLGQADAILTAKKFIKNDFFVINANQFNFHKLADNFISQHSESGDVVTVGITETNDPHKYGIVDLENNRVRGVIEKPKDGKEPSNMRLVGTYLFSKGFLADLVKTPVSDDSLERTLDKLARQGKVGSVRLGVDTPSLKYPWDVLDVKDFILSEVTYGVDSSAIIEKTAVLKGNNIFIGKNAHVCDFSIIEGPSYIGDNAVIGAYSQVRGGTIIEDGAQIERYVDIKNSVVGDNTHIHSGFIGDSVIGKNGRIGAEFITANKRLDRGPIGVLVKGERVDTEKTRLGVLMGDSVKIGIRVSTMPGVVLGSNSSVYPGMTLEGYFESGSNIVK